MINRSRLYFGRVAPIEPQEKQVNGGGWSWRYKVRIFDKHPEDKTLLPDRDLPWAQVLLPVTAGSGAANYAQFPMINQGDVVSISYLDRDEQMPIITGILPRTEQVSNAEPSDSSTAPHTGFTEKRPKSENTPPDESNQSNSATQPSTRSDEFSTVIGDKMALSDTCDPNAYKATAINVEMSNLLNQINKFSDNAQYVESLTTGVVDRVHALVNPYVGQMINNLFESLVPVLNAGLKALYNKIFSIVLAATQNPIAAKLAAEAALIALQPPIQALQEAIQIIAAEAVSNLLGKVDGLVRDVVDNNDRYNTCVGTQFNGAILNSIIDEIDTRIGPLLQAVITVLSGGFNAASSIRGTADIVRDFAGGLLGAGQGGNTCGGLVKEYAFGIGPISDAGDIIDGVLNAANVGESLKNDAISVANSAIGTVDNIFEIPKLIEDFGNFPFMSESSGAKSELDLCNRGKDTICNPPDIVIFGGRGSGAKAKPIVKNGRIVSVEVEDGGSGYAYPPFIEFKDNCGSGIGAVARASLNTKGEVKKIYMVTGGEGYIGSGEDLFYVDTVEIISTGDGYFPGIVTDEFGNDYEVVVTSPVDIIGETVTPETPIEDIDTIIDDAFDPGDPVTEIIPITVIPIPFEPTIIIPSINPPIPTGGRYDPETGLVVDPDDVPVAPIGGIVGDKAILGTGLKFKPILKTLPTIEELESGSISPELAARIEITAARSGGQEATILQIIDCIEN